VTLEVNVDPSQQVPDAVVYYWTYNNVDIVAGLSESEGGNSITLGGENPEHVLLLGDYTVTAFNTESGCFSDTVISVIQGFTPVLEDDTSFTKCANGDVELSVNITNDPNLSNDYIYSWVINGEEVGNESVFVHTEDLPDGPVQVVVSDMVSMCSSETIVMVDYYMNQNCRDIPQGISPNGDGFNDCLVLDHLEAEEDIVKAEIYNRYGVKVFELNDYVDHWCGQDASDGNDSGKLLPVGTYFYVIQFASEREPIISWIYLNY
jgi:gliding motility-associated-like protein